MCMHGLGQRSASGIISQNAIHLDFTDVSVFVSFPVAVIKSSDKSNLREKALSVMAGKSRQGELEDADPIISSVSKWCLPQGGLPTSVSAIKTVLHRNPTL